MSLWTFSLIYERQSRSDLVSATRSSNTVNIILICSREVVINNMCYIWNIKSA